MKKIFVVLTCLLLSSSLSKAQSVYTDSEWNEITGYLADEQWGNANALSSRILNRIPPERKDSDDASIFRYMYIYSEAGLMNEKKVTKAQAQKDVNIHVGRRVFLAAHPLTSKWGFNCMQLVNGKTDTLMTTVSNRRSSQIFSFEYIKFKKPLPIDEFEKNEGKMFGVIGRIKSLKVEGFNMPRFRIFVDEAELIAQ